MFPDELESAFKECPLLYLTYGLCEPHGPQNTLGLDSLKAHGIACRAARRHGGIVAPQTIGMCMNSVDTPFGVREHAVRLIAPG